MEKRHQVFVSSTFLDLKDERRELIQALLELNCFPTAMEMFPAESEDAWSYIKREIDTCDYYIVVIGGRYGSTDVNGLSFTEREFDYADSVGKPIAGFLHERPESLALEKSDMNDDGRARLEAFRSKIRNSKLVKFWNSAGDLAGKVSRSITILRNRNPTGGWIRADDAIAEVSSQTRLQLLEAHQKISDLERRLAEKEAEVRGTIADGSDIVEFTMPLFDADEHLIAYHEVKISFDELFKLIAPQITSITTEEGLRKRVEGRLIDYCMIGITPPWDSTQLLLPTFEGIIWHFGALGLVMKENKRWILTDAGTRRLQRVMAVRRLTSPPMIGKGPVSDGSPDAG